MSVLQNVIREPPDLPHQLRAVAAALGDAKTFVADAAYLRAWAAKLEDRQRQEARHEK